MKRCLTPRLKKILCLLILGTGFLAIAVVSRSLPTFTSKASSKTLTKPKINGYSKDQSIELHPVANAQVYLHAGHALLTDYTGNTAAVEALSENRAEALALASEDFDEDGIKDIVAAYASSNGGIVTVQRGNIDAIYPNMPEAQQRKIDGQFTDAPFFAEASVLEIAQKPDFLGAGDFDGDGHQDLVIASAKDNKLTYLSGDGKGNFKPASQVNLPGEITALECADVNRRDGLSDVLVGIVDSKGAKALIYESPFGAMRANAEIIDLPDAASAFAAGNLFEDYPVDIAIAAGKELLLVKGRDRKLSASETEQAQVKALYIKHRSFAGKIRSVLTGQFSEAKGLELAVLTDDGSVFVVEKIGKRRNSENVKKIANREFSAAQRLTGIRVTKSSTENLLTLDSSKRQLHILSTADTPSGNGKKKVTQQSNSIIATQVDIDGEPVAALPMRLNSDSLSDLVVLRRGQSAITVTPSSTQSNFVVTSSADDGPGSLREAIDLANANPGADSITFNLSGSHTIDLLGALNSLDDPVTIDATTQPGYAGVPLVELNFSGGGNITAGFDVNVAGCTIRGFIMHGLMGKLGQGHGIRVKSDMAIIEGNFVGTNAAGTSALVNSGIGVLLVNVTMVNVGGTTAAARNLISGNHAGGVELSGLATTANSIIGNYIGTDVTGTVGLGNGPGIKCTASPTANTIGGLTAGARNVISGNDTGIVVSGMGNLIQGNYIGVDSTGSAGLGNISDGIFISDAAETVVGGTSAGARNVISGNGGSGILLQGANDGFIQGNLIGLNAAGISGIPNSVDGIQVLDGVGNSIGGTANTAGNTIAFNAGKGINLIQGFSNAILGNSIFSNGDLGIDLNNDGVTANDPDDLDVGPNSLQNFPILDSANQEAGNTRVIGSLQSVNSSQYRIEFFSSVSCDPAGNGEGQRFLGFLIVATDAAGVANFDLLLPLVPAGQVITATATDTMDNNTSEFSPCMPVIGVAGTADLSLSKSATSAQVQAGGSVTYKIILTNLGPGTANNVSVNEATPANTTFRSIDAPPGWTCTSPAQGATGNIICTAPAVLPGTTATFTLVVRVSPLTPHGTVIKNTVKVTTETTDPNVSNDSASATVTVIGSCIINCQANITRNADSGQCGATVTFATPSGSGSCGSIGCVPPSGSFFQRGTTTVVCSASSGSSCSFTVTVNDQQPPTITCPGPVTAQETTAGSGTAMVNYALPATSDNCQGVTTICTPPAGSVFPVGSTPVSCTATDAGGNSASCSFNVIVQGGPPVLEVTIPGDGTGIVFGGTQPVPVGRKPVKDKNSPCSIFSVENKGFTPVEIILESVVRTGSDVDSRRIVDTSDGGLYSVRRLLSGGGEVLVPIGGSVRIGIGERVDFCVKFTPTLPIVPTSATNIPASLVLADRTTSRVTFRVTGGSPFSINTTANVASDLILIDPLNTRRPAVVTFERMDNEFVLTFSLFDANQDVQSMKVELLDGSGSVVASFDIDLVEPVRARNLVKGQSFTIVQKFTGANDNPQVTAARLTVKDLQNTVTTTVNLTSRTASALVQQNESQSVLALPRQRIRY